MQLSDLAIHSIGRDLFKLCEGAPGWPPGTQEIRGGCSVLPVAGARPRLLLRGSNREALGLESHTDEALDLMART